MSQTAGFVHLHTHTEHSLLDGLGRLKDVVAKIVEDGQPAIAQTDHGNLDGSWRFAQIAKKAGVKPILGLEAYLAIEDLTEAEKAVQRRLPGHDEDAVAYVRDEEDDSARFRKNFLLVPKDEGEYGDGDDEDNAESRGALYKNKRYEHLTILARNETGWKNLVQMQNKAQLTYWYKPRIDMALLTEHSEGLIVLTGCLAGPVAGAFLRDEPEIAHRNMRRLINAVGRENVYVEIMEHGIGVEAKVLHQLVDLARNWTDEDGNPDPLPLVATNDAHYVNGDQNCDGLQHDDCHGDCKQHDAWLAVGVSKELADKNRFKFNGSGYHLRTEAEMRSLHDADWWTEACNNTVAIAARCEEEVLVSPGLQLPKFPVPDGFKDAPAFLKHQVMAGAKERWGHDENGKLPEAVRERLGVEFKMVRQMGFCDYFLIVSDLVTWARSDRGVPNAQFPDGEPGKKKPILVGPGRGSAAGSAMSYALTIVDLDPLVHGLLFERFLEPGRLEMPDVDLDFESARRDDVLAYLAARWGASRVSRIGSFSQSKSRRALKDAARVYGETPVGNKLTKLIDVRGGSPLTFAELANVNDQGTEEFRRAIADPSEDLSNILDTAHAFEGVVNGESQHACGVLVSPVDLADIIPIRYDRSKKAPRDADGNPTVIITGWDSKDVEDYGLLKLDVLALENLDIIAVCLDNVLATTGQTLTIEDLPDPNSEGPDLDKMWAMLCDRSTAGVFQLESGGMSALVGDIAPSTFEDLSAAIALFRPGPLSAKMDVRYVERKHGREEVNYSIFTKDKAEQELIAQVLGETFGVYVYQEQIMRLGTVMAGFDGTMRSKLRKAVSKKNAVLMAEVGTAFVEGCLNEQRDTDGELISPVFLESTADTMWEAFKGSAEYLFNKSHTAAYGLLSYYTAYLKANYPVEYGAAILAVTDKDERRWATLQSLALDNVDVLCPDVNLSLPWTSPEMADGKATGNIRLGLSEIRDVGVAGEHVYSARERSGEFENLHDLLTRVKTPDTIDDDGKPVAGGRINIGAVEALIYSGAMDSFGTRLGLARIARASAAHILDVPDCEWPSVHRSALQRERLGLSVGVHPLVAERHQLKQWFTPSYVTDRDDNPIGRPVRHPKDTDGKGEFIGNSPVNLHKVTKGSTLTLGVVAYWTERNGARGRFAQMTLEGSKTRIDAMVWNSALEPLHKSGTVPKVGDIVAVSGVAKERLVQRNAEVETDGQQVDLSEEKQVVMELSVTRIWPVDLYFDSFEMSANTFGGTLVAEPNGGTRLLTTERPLSKAAQKAAQKAAESGSDVGVVLVEDDRSAGQGKSTPSSTPEQPSKALDAHDEHLDEPALRTATGGHTVALVGSIGVAGVDVEDCVTETVDAVLHEMKISGTDSGFATVGHLEGVNLVDDDFDEVPFELDAFDALDETDDETPAPDVLPLVEQVPQVEALDDPTFEAATPDIQTSDVPASGAEVAGIVGVEKPATLAAPPKFVVAVGAASRAPSQILNTPSRGSLGVPARLLPTLGGTPLQWRNKVLRTRTSNQDIYVIMVPATETSKLRSLVTATEDIGERLARLTFDHTTSTPATYDGVNLAWEVADLNEATLLQG